MARATLKDVAQLAGVSTATVSYALSGKRTISDETKQRIHDAIAELDYVPDLNARGLSMRDSKLIGVVVPQTEPGDRLMFQNSFYSEVLGSIEFYARQQGYHILISATDANESYLTLAKQRNLDGIIVIGMYPDEFYQEMKKTQIPIVLIDSYCNDHYYHNIRIDDAYGISLAQQLLAERLPVTGIVAAADILAIGAIKGLFEAGKSVPNDYSIVGFDDVEVAQYLTPGLTTIRQQISLKGLRAVELLLKHIENPALPKQEEILPLELIQRGSVRNLNAK